MIKAQTLSHLTVLNMTDLLTDCQQSFLYIGFKVAFSNQWRVKRPGNNYITGLSWLVKERVG